MSLLLLANFFHQKGSWTLIKPAQQAKDGCMGYQLLHDRYLGPNNVYNIDNASEGKLKSTSYNGEKKL
jgi:hypothetical protein